MPEWNIWSSHVAGSMGEAGYGTAMVAGEPDPVLPDPDDGEWPRLVDAMGNTEDMVDIEATEVPGVSGECMLETEDVCGGAFGLSLPVGPFPSGGLFAGGKLSAARS